MFEHLIGLLSTWTQSRELRNAERAAKSSAISAVRSAIRATREHIDQTREGEFGESDDVASEKLVAAWSIAAEKIRPIDPDLAGILEYKSDYWNNPIRFRQDCQDRRIRFTYRIRLDEVERELMEI